MKTKKKVVKKTKAERRIEILKDAIKQIKLQKIIASPGEVVDLNDPLLIEDDVYKEVDAKPRLEMFFKSKKVEPCFACARGSLLLCTVHKENDFILSDFNSCGGSFEESSTTDKRLMRLFSKQQLILMENAFEVENMQDDEEDYNGINEDYLSSKLNKASIDFGLKYEDPNERLIAIFSNAIKNGGIFKP